MLLTLYLTVKLAGYLATILTFYFWDSLYSLVQLQVQY